MIVNQNHNLFNQNHNHNPNLAGCPQGSILITEYAARVPGSAIWSSVPARRAVFQ